MPTKIAEATFEARVVKETSMCAQPVADFGVVKNRVVLYLGHGPGKFCVEWTADNHPEVYADIGIWADGAKKVLDYDGVFSLPPEIAAFLRAQGFDTSEVEA